MFNLLVSILSDTYDRVQENQRATDLTEKGKGIVEVDTIMKKMKRSKQRYPDYLFCTFMTGYDEAILDNAWEGKVKAIKKQNEKLNDELRSEITEVKKEMIVTKKILVSLG